ncbi:hypothetical protein [Actinoplanes sp. NPDC051851]|uniref:hypothetical protein n=1 Tax=Actinoplanes sp. NPDC051851 TaxID=3154753 RepID=UPI00342D9A3F
MPTTPEPPTTLSRPNLSRRRVLVVAAAAAVTTPLIAPFGRPAVAAPRKAPALTVGAGETYTFSSTSTYGRLILEEGGALAAPDGYDLSVTVDGVEVGATLESLYVDDGIHTYIAAGTYSGQVVVTVAAENLITYQGSEWPIRQALYVDADGVSSAKSVLAAVRGGRVGLSEASGVSITSRGQAFNGVWVAGGSYTLTKPAIAFTGNGRCDFVGYGSGIVGSGAGTTLVVDGATIRNEGVVRDGIVADDGAVLVVKNSTISVKDGVLPEEYENTGDPAFMMSCPWLLGMYGTVRATNTLGVNTRATYLNTQITNENWALWSIDSGAYGGKDIVLVVVNSTGRHTGTDGYGSYAIGNPTEYFLGVTLDVATYVAIIWGSAGMHYGDSSRATVDTLNTSLGLGLTASDIRCVESRPSRLTSRKFGFMWHSTGPVHIDGRTRLHTDQTTFLSKAVASSVFVDGSAGATLSTGNGVLYQIIDNDNPGRVAVTDKPWSAEYTKSYVQPTADPVKSATFDPAVVHTADATGSFSHITLAGDFYNGVLGGGVGNLQGQNLVLTFTDARVTGTISASRAVHPESPINFDNYDQLGVVTNTPTAVVNNGVIVTLSSGSVWSVSRTSYLSALTLSADSSIVTASGSAPVLTVDGVETALTPGSSYTGAITLTV